jgi:hypothetical protein
MRSKARTALTAPLLLHCTTIGKYAMKKFGINGQCQNKKFLIVSHRFSLLKAAMNVPHLCKLRINCLTGFDQCAMMLSNGIYDSKLQNEKTLYSKCATNFRRPHLNWLPNCQL